MKPQPFHISRRNFLKASTATAAGLALPGWFLAEYEGQSAPKPLGPNDRPGIALIGCGGQGSGDCSAAAQHGNVLAVCDVDDKQADAAVKRFTVKDGKKPEKYKDFRKVMERDDIHVVINGTPDHWHTMVNLAASKTGKDIYTEKPMTLTIDEGKRLVKAVRQNKTVLQVGSQQRSDRNFRLACELVRNGRIGKLQHIIVGLPTGPREGPFKPLPAPAEIDWDYYLGQTPKVDYNGHNAHGNFRWWYQFSGGQMTDWGAHHNDIAQWGNDSELSGPTEIDGKSLIEMIPGGYNAASQYRIGCKYANGVTMVITDENSPTEQDVFNDKQHTRNGVQFIGPEGWIYVARGAIQASKQEILEEKIPDGALRLYKSDDHMRNFFECVRSRKDPICPVEVGHRSISVAHLGVISVRMKQPLSWDPAKQEFTGANAAEASLWLAREHRAPYNYDFIG